MSTDWSEALRAKPPQRLLVYVSRNTGGTQGIARLNAKSGSYSTQYVFNAFRTPRALFDST
jgi:hypothetical protein